MLYLEKSYNELMRNRVVPLASSPLNNTTPIFDKNCQVSYNIKPIVTKPQCVFRVLGSEVPKNTKGAPR